MISYMYKENGETFLLHFQKVDIDDKSFWISLISTLEIVLMHWHHRHGKVKDSKVQRLGKMGTYKNIK